MKTPDVLVVDDDILIGMLLIEMLEAMGHEVFPIATSEAEAVAAADQCPGLMIVDLGLGGGSGLVAVDRILADGYIPHIFMSGAARALEALGSEAIVLRKPFNEDQLARAIAAALDRQNAERRPPNTGGAIPASRGHDVTGL